MIPRSTWALALVCMSLAACEGANNNSSWSTAKPSTSTTESTAATPAPGAPPTAGTSSGKGIGPVDHVDLAALDESRVPAGEALFQLKCSACHKLEERYIGPALAGVTMRRQPEWILNQILNPEVMIAQDPTAKALLAEYIAPMANQHLTRDEAESILVYFREHDEALGESAGSHDHETAEKTGDAH